MAGTLTRVNGVKVECHANNPKLKTVQQEIPFTQEQIFEMAKCKKDIVYFAKNYCKIVHIDHGLINFEPYPYQEDMLYHMQHNRFSILKTGRQMGKCVSKFSYIKIRRKNLSFFKNLLVKLLKGNINEKL